MKISKPIVFTHSGARVSAANSKYSRRASIWAPDRNFETYCVHSFWCPRKRGQLEIQPALSIWAPDRNFETYCFHPFWCPHERGQANMQVWNIGMGTRLEFQNLLRSLIRVPTWTRPSRNTGLKYWHGRPTRISKPIVSNRPGARVRALRLS